jgi:hypothetical protein
MRIIQIDPKRKKLSVMEISGRDDAAFLEAVSDLVGGAAEIRYRYAGVDVLFVNGEEQYAPLYGEVAPIFQDIDRSLFCRGIGVIIGMEDGRLIDARKPIEDAERAFRFCERYPDPAPSYGSRVKPGDRVTAGGILTTRNSCGGTEIIRNMAIQVDVTRVWYDYETGYRCLGRVVDAQVAAEIRRKATSKYGVDWVREKHPDNATAILRAVEAELNWDPEIIAFHENDIERLCVGKV